MGIILFFIVILIVSAFVPEYALMFLVLNLIAGLFLCIFQITIALLPDFKPKRSRIKTQPFVSVLVPAYNEPPTILMQTLEAFSRPKYDHFEVLVIDNNTKGPAVWKPVKTFINLPNT